MRLAPSVQRGPAQLLRAPNQPKAKINLNKTIAYIKFIIIFDIENVEARNSHLNEVAKADDAYRLLCFLRY